MTAGERDRKWRGTIPNLDCHNVVKWALVSRSKRGPLDHSSMSGYVANVAHTGKPFMQSDSRYGRMRNEQHTIHRVRRIVTVWDRGEFLTMAGTAQCGGRFMTVRVMDEAEPGERLCRKCFCECA